MAVSLRLPSSGWFCQNSGGRSFIPELNDFDVGVGN